MSNHYSFRGVLPESIISACNYNLSAIEFYCSPEESDLAMKQFMETFEEKWYKEFPVVLNAYHINWDDYDDDEKEWMYDYNQVRVTPFLTDYGFRADIPRMEIWVGEDNGMPDWTPLIDTLEIFREKYPHIRYRGYVGFLFSDHLGGQAEQAEFYSGSLPHSKKYDSIGNGLKEAVLDDDFWEYLFGNLAEASQHEINEVLSVMDEYEKWLDGSYLSRAIKAAEATGNSTLTTCIRTFACFNSESTEDNGYVFSFYRMKDGKKYHRLSTELIELVRLSGKMMSYGEAEIYMEEGLEPEKFVRTWAISGDEDAKKLFGLLDQFDGDVVWDKNGDILVSNDVLLPSDKMTT